MINKQAAFTQGIVDRCMQYGITNPTQVEFIHKQAMLQKQAIDAMQLQQIIQQLGMTGMDAQQLLFKHPELQSMSDGEVVQWFQQQMQLQGMGQL